jgi:hypothetical protein
MLCYERHKRSRVGLAAATLALAALVASTAPAMAAINDASFTLKVSEKEKALSDPTNAELQNFLMWDLGADRVANRNMPYFELLNDLTSDAPITEFRMSIGDSRFHFDCEMVHSCAMLAKTTPGIALSSSVADNGNTLVLNFGNGGLDPGELVRFKIALAVDSGNNFYKAPDFRTVLFDMNEINVYDGMLHTPSNVDETADNAKVSALFKQGSESTTVGPVPFDDFSVNSVASQYFNDNYRRYGVMEPVESFLIVGFGGSTIPEPGSFLLVAIGAACVSQVRARRRPRISG